MNCVKDLAHPFHEGDSKPILSQCSIYSLLKLNNHQSWFELHWQSLQIALTKSSMCSTLSKSNHTQIRELRIRLKENFIFEFDFFPCLIINFEEACTFTQFFDPLKQHDDEKMYLFKHLAHLILHWNLLQVMIRKLMPHLYQNRFLLLIKLMICVTDKFY